MLGVLALAGLIVWLSRCALASSPWMRRLTGQLLLPTQVAASEMSLSRVKVPLEEQDNSGEEDDSAEDGEEESDDDNGDDGGDDDDDDDDSSGEDEEGDGEDGNDVSGKRKDASHRRSRRSA